jgi:hypothetical protein
MFVDDGIQYIKTIFEKEGDAVLLVYGKDKLVDFQGDGDHEFYDVVKGVKTGFQRQ